MRYAIFSDVHANLRAWESVLADIRAQRVDVLICLGDVVGYGPKPVEVLESIRSVTSNFVMGNHDAAAIGAMDYSVFNDHARHSTEWTAEALTDEAREFLSSVPIAIEDGDLFFVHAEAAEPGRFDYITDVGIAEENFEAGEHFVTFVGHTHHPKVFEKTKNGRVLELPDTEIVLKPSSRYIINVGSVGEPRSADDLRARYVIYDSDKRRVDFRAVIFDIPAYREDLDTTSLQVTPFFLSVFEQETGMLAQDWIVENGVAPLSGGDWIDASGSTGTVQLHEGGEVSSRKSFWLHRVLPAVAAILVLAVPGAWMMQRLMNARQQVPEVEVADLSSAPESQPVEEVESLEDPKLAVVGAAEEAVPVPAKEVAVAKPPKNNRLAVRKPAGPKATPAEPKPIEVPTPKPVPAKPKPPGSPQASVVAWWRMDAPSATLKDLQGRHSLETLKAGTGIKPIGPSRLPVVGLDNGGAMQLGVWSEPAPSGAFGLQADRSFTWEAWVLSDRVKRPVFLAGTRSGDAGEQQGWHVDLRPPSGQVRRGQVSFFWDSGPKMVQALSGDVMVTDLRAHHIAAVWDHDVGKDTGEMRLYLDGEKAASTKVHHSLIAGPQVNGFRIGAPGNPERLAMDEVRFTQAALDPLEFLGAEPQIMNQKGSWVDNANWSEGRPPSGQQTAVVGPRIAAESSAKAPKFEGDLVLRAGASLKITDDGEGVMPLGPSKLIMEEGSKIVITSKRGGVTTFGPVLMNGRAEIWGGVSTQGHHTTRLLGSEVSGDHPLILIGVNNNQFRMTAANSFAGGFLAESRQNQGFRVVAEAAECFSSGRVHIGGHASLILAVEGTIDDRSTLVLSGPMDSRVKAKLVIDANETVNRLQIDGADQRAGTWGAPGSGADHEHDQFAGTGILTVLQ